MISSSLKDNIVDKELVLLEELDVRNRLRKVVSSSYGLGIFAQEFYFIRCDFCRLNFIVGAKCPPHEKYWSGLTKNLLEELGGGRTATHNQLYREFLWESCQLQEQDLTSPQYAVQFNRLWENYCRKQAYREGLLAIGLYEALDNPDYELMHAVVKESGISEKGLKFFSIHAKAEHYEMFEEIIEEIQESEDEHELVERTLNFVISTQKFMWSNLLNSLEKNLINASNRPQKVPLVPRSVLRVG